MGLVFSLTQEARAENPLILCPALPVRNCSAGKNGRVGNIGMGNETSDRKAALTSEAEAIAHAKNGDSSGFEHLYEVHRRHVYALCLRMVTNPTEAEDLTQDAFLQVFRKIQTFRGESGFSTWLHRVTVNVVLMRFRRKKHAELSLDQPSELSDGDRPVHLDPGQGDLGLIGAIDRVLLQRAVDSLPDGYKQMFVLHDIEGYEHHEIASILGCSVGNSKSQLHKARLRLRALLQEQVRGKAGGNSARGPAVSAHRRAGAHGPVLSPRGAHTGGESPETCRKSKNPATVRFPRLVFSPAKG